MQTDWPFGHLTPLKYKAILADPPWSYKMRSEKGYGKSPEEKVAAILETCQGDLRRR